MDLHFEENVNNTTVISSYYSWFGIADFIRASLNLYSFCKKRNYAFYIDFKGTPYETLFDTPTFKNQCSINIRDATGTPPIGYREEEFENKIIPGKTYNFTINYIIITPDIYPDSFLDIFKPSESVLNYIESLHFPKEYIAVHIRLNDSCIGTVQNIDFEKYKETIEKINETCLPVIIFSNNEYIKKVFKEKYSFLIHEMPILHTGNATGINKEKKESYLKTIAEFYLIGFSSKVLSFHYSGFSHISSYLYKKEYIVTFDHPELKYLNDYIKYNA